MSVESAVGSPRSAGGFFRSRWVDAPDGVEQLDPAQLAPGFRAAGVHCGLKQGGATDVGVVVCDAATVSSAVLLTASAAPAAPVVVCRDECDQAGVRACVVNSGNANAATGEQGLADARALREAGAEGLGLDPSLVVVAETGIIGVPLELEAAQAGAREAVKRAGPDGGSEFARAIMTTDDAPKSCSLRAGGVTVSAQAKGAGMIRPGFATLLCFVQTDAVVAQPARDLRRAVDASFERITVDGQMSTNDTVVLQAGGASGRPLPEGLLDAVLLQLALDVVADGEGASRTGRVTVDEAADSAEAESVARAIANSPLVKTALYGRDANWGRIAQAAGMALAGREMPEPTPETIDFEELGADGAEADIAIRLGRGDASAHVYFSDLTPDYVRLNSEYPT